MNPTNHFADLNCDPLQKKTTPRHWHKVISQLFNYLLLAGLLFFSSNLEAQYFMQPANDNTFHILDQYYQLSHSGAYRDFKVPAEAEGRYLYLEARGGDGGTIDFASAPKHVGNGGQGATVIGYFKVGAAANEIPVGATVRIIVGQAGGSWTNTGQTNHHDGGGGGGTGILFLAPGKDPLVADAPDWHLLMVAGGGGGGHADWMHTIVDGKPANDGELSTDVEHSQFMWYNSFCNPEVQLLPGWGGRNTQAGGGAGYTLMKDFCDGLSDRDEPIGNPEYSSNSGFGGFQRNNGKMQPVGGATGTCNQAGNRGGYGFGSGACGRGGSAGGGGGYSGGTSGSFGEPAEGAGSYLNLIYCHDGSGRKYQNGITDKSIDGYVRYRITYIDLFQPLPGAATDVAAGNDGSLWKISDEPATGGYKIYKYNGSTWELKNGGGTRIAVAYSGIPWLVNDQGDIFRATDANASGWTKLPGKARDIAVNNGGRPWIIGTTPTGGGYSIHYWTGSQWIQVPGGGLRIGAGDVPWVVNDSHKIYRAPANENFTNWQEVSGFGLDIGVSQSGQGFVVGTDHQIYRRDGNSWTPTQVNGDSVSAGVKAITAYQSGIYWIIAP